MDSIFGPRPPRVLGRVAKIRGVTGRAAAARQRRQPRASRIRRVTSAPSARPRVSRMTGADQRADRLLVARRAPSAAASGSAAIARATISASPPSSSIAPRPARRDDRRGLAALLDQHVQHLARRGCAERARCDHRDERGQRRRLDAARRRVAVADPRHELAADPVGERRRRARRRRASARSKKSPSSPRKASWWARSALSPSSRSKRSARAAGSSPIAGARRVEHRLRWSRSATRSGSGK